MGGGDLVYIYCCTKVDISNWLTSSQPTEQYDAERRPRHRRSTRSQPESQSQLSDGGHQPVANLTALGPDQTDAAVQRLLGSRHRRDLHSDGHACQVSVSSPPTSLKYCLYKCESGLVDNFLNILSYLVVNLSIYLQLIFVTLLFKIT